MGNVKVTFELVFPLMVAGLKVVVTLAGNPLTDKETEELNPRIGLMETLDDPLKPWWMVSEFGFALIEKSGTGVGAITY
jgi:hypothetical protein